MLLAGKRYFRYFDWISFFLTLLLTSIGILFVFSSTYKPDQPYSIFFKKQLFGFGSGLILYFIFCIIDYRILFRWGYLLYIIVISSLIFTLIKGSIGMGGRRWIDLMLFRFQPSEVAKLFFPAFITYHLHLKNDTPHYFFRDFISLLIAIVFSSLLIMKQPDLGTALIILCGSSLVLWVAGLNKKFFIAGLLIIIISAPLSWKLLRPYQKRRIEVFLGEGDRKKERYQLEQSKIALGSGQLFGKGFLQGTQNKLMFLPESRTDCIFSVIGEELGFAGTLAIIILYALLLIRLFYVITTVNYFFAQLLALGLVIPIGLSAIINMAMVCGLLPIVGIPLPLISYGITNLWVSFASLGWINGIAIRRFYIGE